MTLSNTLEELFVEGKLVLLLYESKRNNGHWCCLIDQPAQVIFFDPYALLPDDQLEFTNIKFRKRNNMHLPYLTYLLYHSKKPIDYNNKQMQVMRDEVATCGYWCGIRMRLDYLDSEEFIDIFRKFPLKERDNIIIATVNNLS